MHGSALHLSEDTVQVSSVLSLQAEQSPHCSLLQKEEQRRWEERTPKDRTFLWREVACTAVYQALRHAICILSPIDL